MGSDNFNQILSEKAVNEKAIDELLFLDEQGWLFRTFLWALMAIGLFFFWLTVVRDSLAFHSSIGLLLAIIGGVGLVLERVRSLRSGVLWVLGAMWILISLWPYVAIGVRSPVLYGYPVFILLAGWLLGRRTAICLGGLSAVNLLSMYLGEMAGWLKMRVVRESFHYFTTEISVLILATFTAMIVGEGVRKQLHRQFGLSRELRQRVEALQRMEESSAQLFNRNPLPSFVTRVEDGLILEVNDAWVRSLGWSREEALGRTVMDLGLWDRAEDRQQAVSRILKEKHLPPRLRSLQTSAGELRSYLIYSEMVEADGESRLLNNMLDQTERLQAEEEVRRLNATLEAKVEERTTELKLAVQTLKDTQEELVHSEKMASLGALVAGVSHDLNTPIGNTLTVASTLQERVHEFNRLVAKGELKKSALLDFLTVTEEMSDLLVRSCKRAAELVASFKQVAADQASERRREFDLKELVDDVLVTLRPGFKHSPWVLDSDIPGGILCESYPGPLGQVLTNLVQNACLHAFDSRDHGTVRVSVSRASEGWVRLTVSDDGVGMDADTLARVFDPFFTTRLGKGGSGLGSSIAYRIVTSILGGAISAESEPGKGTCFTLFFPCVAPEHI